jgi:C1A family cysteine protease
MTIASPTSAGMSEAGRTLPAAVDLSPNFDRWGISTRPQGARGTCSVFAVVGALEYALATHQNHGVHLSVEFLNWAGHRATGRTVDGGFFWDLWDGYEQFGMCSEEDLPYASAFDAGLEPSAAVLNAALARRGVVARPNWVKEWEPETGLTDATFVEVKQTLATGHPVCGGFRWPKTAEWNDDLLAMAAPSDVFDGHSVLLSGYVDDPNTPGGGWFTIRNSQAADADGRLSYEYVRAYMNDAAWVEPAH